MTKEDFILAIEEWYLTGNEDSITFLGSLYDKVTQPQWISVEDELPFEYEPVLAVVDGNEYAFVGTCDGENDSDFFDCHDNKVKNVTHWMHLPQPPVIV